MSYAVVIVNWNGATDTVACLESIRNASPEAVPIVVDNGSVDDSIDRILAHFRNDAVDPLVVACLEGDDAAATMTRPALRWAPGDRRAAVIDAGGNRGFAAGCNLGLALAHAAGIEVVVFLNNDTIVEPRALDLIVGRLLAAADCFACLPMLTVHGSDRIWNCGGAVYGVGLRRYFLAGRPRSEGAAAVELRCTFFTGCCFAVRTADFVARSGFSERFFFGEEDFELALWMKDRGLRAVCLTAAVVQHQVSASFDRAAAEGERAKVSVYYLNRFIHMRLRLGRLRWSLWLAACLPYTAVLLVRKAVVRPRRVVAFLHAIVLRSLQMDGVDREVFEDLMHHGLQR